MASLWLALLLALLPSHATALTCQDASLKGLKFCDRSAPVSERVADLLPRLNLTDKIGQTGMVATAVPAWGMQEYNFGGEALHGVWASCISDNFTTPTHKPTGRLLCPTQFPAPIHMSCAFNRDLWRQMADVSSTEARALYRNNQLRHPADGGFGAPCSRSLEGCLGLSYYTPNVNLARDPRWGRIEETPGEDPFINGEYAFAFTKGFQEGYANGSSPYLKASVTVKHFVAYNVEIDVETTDPATWCGSELNEGGACTLPNDRHSFNAHVSQQDLVETFLPPFQQAVKAQAGAIMCSYNAVNGEPMCTNKDLIGGTLREDFGFTGVLATDCGALRDATEHHHRYKDDKDTATAAIRAGVDSNCGSVFPRALPWAFGNGTMEPSDLDASVARLLAARFRLGLFDEGDASADVPLYNIEDVDDAANKAVALKAARQGVVLLQNGVAGAKAKLPLSKGIYKKVAMVGPNANATMNLLSGYHGSPPFLVSPLAAMRAKWGGESAVLYSVGCNVSDVDNKGNVTPAAVVQAAIDAATKTAVTADVTVLGLGLCGDNYGGGPPKEDSTCYKIDEAEATDRSSLALPGSQMELFRAIHKLGKPLVVFVMNAGPLDLAEIKASGVPIIAAGYGGEYGGQATADVLAGDYNPGGATTTTWYPEAYAHAASFRDMGMRPNASTGNPGRTYKFLDEAKVEPVFRFGHGASYTNFSITLLQGPTAPLAPGEESDWFVQVENTGELVGDVVVVCYVKATKQAAVAAPPLRSVFDFARVEELAPKKTTLLSFKLTPRGRALVTEDGEWVTPAGEYEVICEAGSLATTAPAKVTVVG